MLYRHSYVYIDSSAYIVRLAPASRLTAVPALSSRWPRRFFSGPFSANNDDSSTVSVWFGASSFGLSGRRLRLRPVDLYTSHTNSVRFLSFKYAMIFLLSRTVPVGNLLDLMGIDTRPVSRRKPTNIVIPFLPPLRSSARKKTRDTMFELSTF